MMESENRNPDAILKQIETDEYLKNRGKLKIFFGYAAGVGKTYSMLIAAHGAKEDGIDVVAGYIEPHARPETMELMKGLEVLPLKIISHQNITLKEFDLDLALIRKPQLILVDELAHTNGDGCRHRKRYQDIEELLKAGIDVYTTVNVQHLESLNDVVAGITGVVVKERISDSFFDEANQVELVDIEPEDLLIRLKTGKVYKELQAKQAMKNFFTLENLVALREIALRRMADRVNLLQENTTLFANEGEIMTAEHILICLSSSPSNEKVIRQAARMATAFHGKFTAFFVETSNFKKMSKEDIDRLNANMKLAGQLGAKIVTSYGNDIVEQIAEFAKISRVSKIVLGRTYTKRSFLFVGESFSDRLTKMAPNLEIFLIPDSYERKHRIKGTKKYSKYLRKDNRIMIDTLISFVVMVGSTVIAYWFHQWGFNDSNLVMVYLLGVLMTSLLTQNRIYSAISCILSVLLFNYLFIKPTQTFSVDEPGYSVTFLIMFFTGFISSSLTRKVKNYARVAAKKAYRTEVLLETSQKLQSASDDYEIAKSTAEQLGKLLEKNIIMYIGNPELYQNAVVYCYKDERNMLDNKQERAVAEWVYKNNKHAGFSTSTLPGVRGRYLAIRNGDKVFAVVGIDMKGKEIAIFEEGIMSAILNECALAMEKDEILKEREEVAIRLKQEQLRTNLLRSISHDLRTPLTSISGNAGMLISNADKLSEGKKEEFYMDIYDDSMWLINLVENLLSVTRIENGTMQLNLHGEVLDDVISEALQHVNRKSVEHHIVVDQEDDMLVARMDAKLIMQVIINLVDNAIKYTPPKSEIFIKTRKNNHKVIIEVSDNGNGVSDEDKKHLFDMFYTVEHSVADGRRGTGLGLSLCKSIVQAHGGVLTVDDNYPKGTVFRFSLKAEEVYINGQ